MGCGKGKKKNVLFGMVMESENRREVRKGVRKKNGEWEGRVRKP